MIEAQGLTTGNQTITGETDQRLKIFEMGESGQAVSFPMTEKEIAAEDAHKVPPRAVHDLKATRDGRKTIIFELAESGQTIEFPEENVEVFIEDVAGTDAKAKKDPGKNPNG